MLKAAKQIIFKVCFVFTVAKSCCCSFDNAPLKHTPLKHTQHTTKLKKQNLKTDISQLLMLTDDQNNDDDDDNSKKQDENHAMTDAEERGHAVRVFVYTGLCIDVWVDSVTRSKGSFL